MVEIDPITGLPKELGAWETIAKEDQKILVQIVKKKYGKSYTQITGIDNKDVNVKEITTKLKSKFACGGTAKDGYIELQGDYLSSIKGTLASLGFPEETIELKR
ncbi:MAG: stress response translation initiation inhibitor YciH [Candidatus Woesearchaeota archaeon]